MPLNTLRMGRLRKHTQHGYWTRPAFNPPSGLWINGVDYTSFLIVDSPHIRNTAYPQTGVFSFRLEGAIGGPLATVRVEQEVTFNLAGVTYAGVIRTSTPDDLRPGLIGLDVECQDFTAMLDSDVCGYTFPGPNPYRTTVETDQQRISWLLQSFDRYGLSSYNVQALTASLPAQDFTGMTLTAAIKAVLAFSGGQFYVDFAKDLHTFVTDSAAAPFALSDTPDSVTSFPYAAFDYPRDSVDLRNAVYVIPGSPDPFVADQAQASIVCSQLIIPVAIAGVLASLRPAKGRRINQVGLLGSVALGGASTVSPTFGQPTSRGNCLVAWVGFSQVQPSATTAPGWVKLKEQALSSAVSVALWVKPNCSDSEVPPTFTCGGSGSPPMGAQLGEFWGVDSTTPLEQAAQCSATGPPAGDPAATATIQNQVGDSAPGNLALLAMAWPLNLAGTATFGETFNNQTATVHAGDSGTSSVFNQYSFSYGIIGSQLKPKWYTDDASIATYGRREASISGATAKTQADVDALGAAYLAANANPLQEASCAVRQPGLQAGQTISVTNALHGLVAQSFRIQGVDTTFGDNTPRFVVRFSGQPVTLSSQIAELRDAITSSSATAPATSGNVGILGYAEVIADQPPFVAGALTDITGLTVTITATGRRIQIVGDVKFSSTVADGQFGLYIYEGATQLNDGEIPTPAANAHARVHVQHSFVPTAGTHTYNLKGQRLNGTGVVTMRAASNAVASISVEDIGT